MKISITLSDVDAKEALYLLAMISDPNLGKVKVVEVDDPEKAMQQVTGGAFNGEPSQTVSPPADGSVEVAKPKPKRRRRRTKAEMADAAQAETAEAKAAPEEAAPFTSRRRTATTEPAEPTQRRRRTPGPTDAAPSAAAPTEDPTTTASTASPSNDEVTDNDVVKAASAAAEQLTPDVVMAVLEEFGVNNVGMLDQDARRDFISVLDQKVDDNLPNG